MVGNEDGGGPMTEDGDVCLVVLRDGSISPGDYRRLLTAIGDLVRAEGGLGIQRISSKQVFPDGRTVQSGKNEPEIY